MKLDHVSTYLILFSAGLTATQMHPSFTSVLVYLANLGVLFIIRGVAHQEGHAKK